MSSRTVKTPFPVTFSDYSEIDRYVSKSTVQVFHDEGRATCLWDVFAVFLMTFLRREVDFEMSAVVADLNDAEIRVGRNASMCCRLSR